MLKFRTSFPGTWRICPKTALDMGLPEVLGLTVILYSSSIRYFLNSWPINSDTWSYVISIGLGYLYRHVVSTKFAIDISLLLSYCAISNHTVTGSIIVTAFICKFSFLPFLLMTEGTIRSTHMLFHGIFSSNLSSNLPYFYLIFVYVRKCHN